MRKIIIIISALMAFCISALGAEGWELDSDITFSLTQSQFSENWGGTEQSNITWTATSNSLAQKQLKAWLRNKNTLKIAFGQTHQQKRDILGDPYWEKPQKSTDQINLESLFQFTLQTYIDPYISLRADSKILDEAGAETILINPTVFTESAGIMKSLINREATKLDLRFGAAINERWDRRVDGTPVDGGLEGIAELKHKLVAMNANLTSRLSAYQALFNSKEDELPNDYWKALDYKWENTLSFKLWKLLNLNLNLDVIYDKDKVNGTQWREVMGLGISYTLF